MTKLKMGLMRTIKAGAVQGRRWSRQRGSLLVGVLIIAVAFVTVGVAVMSYASSTYTLAVKATDTANATLVAEAGVETSLYQLNADNNFSGYGSEQVFFNDASQGRATYTTTVANTATNARTITSTGKLYRYNSTTNPLSVRKVKVTVVGTAGPGYSVHTGPGGLILSGSAQITNADVYANGFLQMSGAARIGTNAQPRNVFVANLRCPTGATPGPTYPQVCTGGAGGQPITMSGSAAIYGTVCATGQTVSTGIYTGSGGAGLQAGCVAPPVQPPVYDKAAQVSAVTTTAASNNSAYTCSGVDNKTWPANLRLNGNVSLGGSCKLTVNGNVYITGNLDLGGAMRITVANGAGTNRPVILVDGTVNVGGSVQMVANNQGTGFHFVSYKATASCNPNCTTLSGNDLKNSQNVTTMTVGGGGNSAGMIFQSQWGKAVLNGSGNVGAMAGQTVDLSGAGTVVFGTTLSSGSTTWTISSYQRLFN